MVCLKHHDRQAVAVCAACGKPLCEECVMEYNGSAYCSGQCRDKGEDSKARSNETISSGKKIKARARRRFWLTVFLLIALGAGGYYLYTNHQKTIDSGFSSGLQELKKSTGKAIRAGKEAMPGESRYKRERENLVD